MHRVAVTPRVGAIDAVFVEVVSAFSLAISESKTKTMCIPIPRELKTPDSLQRNRAAVPLDNLLRLVERRSH